METLQKLIEAITNKQQLATQEVNQQFWSLDIGGDGTRKSQEINFDTAANRKYLDSEAINPEAAHNVEKINESKNQRKTGISLQQSSSNTKTKTYLANRDSGRGTPISGFKFNEENDPESSDMPSPQLLESAVHNKINQHGDELSELSMMPIKDQQANPEQNETAMKKSKKNSYVSEIHSQIVNKFKQSSNKSIKNQVQDRRIGNLQLRKLNYVQINARKSVKTQNSYEDSEVWKNQADLQSNKEVPGALAHHCGRCSQSKCQIYSGVVSYSQSLNQSTTTPMAKNKKLPTIRAQKPVKSKGKRSSKQKTSQEGKKRMKTQQHASTREYIEKLEKKFQKQKQSRVQLREVVQKKHKLQQKLKKLNRELQKIQKSQSFRYNTDNATPVNGMKYSRVENSGISLSFINKSRLSHEKEMQNSKNAIKFIEKVSRESLKRRISYQKKMNREIIERVREHACIDCSRGKCQKEAIQGHFRSENPNF